MNDSPKNNGERENSTHKITYFMMPFTRVVTGKINPRCEKSWGGEGVQ